jgi:hypothetical protein
MLEPVPERLDNVRSRFTPRCWRCRLGLHTRCSQKRCSCPFWTHRVLQYTGRRTHASS